ncbi:MAG: DUF4058 family protein [Armatimonadetes bacterium]|nr:DUF4058 family protein [Armatimonadota bacterium]
MPSPFPGMDPFIEGQRWEHFHGEFIYEMHRALMPQLTPQYISVVGERVYVEWVTESPAEQNLVSTQWRIPDVAIIEIEPKSTAVATKVETEILVEIEPELAKGSVEVELTEPAREIYRERFVEIRVRETGELVTVIELLSPANKRKGGVGWHEYMTKRHEFLFSQVHLVEMDLLRFGERMPIRKGEPKGEYQVMVSRWEWRPKALIWGWGLREKMPTVPIPLKGRDEWAKLNLQEVFNTVYERGGYRYLLDYGRSVEPPLSERDRAWVDELLSKALQTTS